MQIRKAETGDYESICLLVKEAFDSSEHSDGNEHELVDALRESAAFIPELSLVAELDGRIVGHILFTKAAIGDSTELALAPLSVLPGYQRQGIGTALIREGHRIALALGYGYSVVLGSERYYPRVGYVPAENFGIRPPFDVPRENFMACKLNENARSVSGTIQYAKEFGIN